MGRKKIHGEYHAEEIFQEYMEAVVEAYQAPDPQGKPNSLRSVADAFGASVLKIRKVLITAGVFQTELSMETNRLRQAGLTIEEIQERLHLSRASVHSYLPYTKYAYNARESSANANRLRIYRKRKEAQQLFCARAEDGTLTEDQIWDTLAAFAGYPFYTSKGLKLTYTVKGYELFVDRKEKSITRATVLLFVERVRQMQASGGFITGPKQVGTFGASYLFPIFRKIGLIAAPAADRLDCEYR